MTQTTRCPFKPVNVQVQLSLLRVLHLPVKPSSLFSPPSVLFLSFSTPSLPHTIESILPTFCFFTTVPSIYFLVSILQSHSILHHLLPIPPSPPSIAHALQILRSHLSRTLPSPSYSYCAPSHFSPSLSLPPPPWSAPNPLLSLPSSPLLRVVITMTVSIQPLPDKSGQQLTSQSIIHRLSRHISWACQHLLSPLSTAFHLFLTLAQ